ncbi:hypothetical protein C8J57DRAFT_1726205 [Mycena rebaudengoi]|nr:hypothetical protein C8J57DRAFT_1726205 [Mycena rebaudengoi]
MSVRYQIVPTEAPGDGEEEEKNLHRRPGLFNKISGSAWSVPILFAIIFVQSVGLTVASSLLYWRSHPVTAPKLYSPAQDAVEETIEVYHLGFGQDLSPFQVQSSPELDQAWDDLYEFGISRIPGDQAALLPNKTSPIPGDPGFYIAELDVFHELHCLNMIRKALDPDYYPDWDIKKGGFASEHVSHCVEWIRNSIMCHSDTSVIVWQWNEHYNQSTPKATIPHTCRNFNKIQRWGQQNTLVGEYNDTIHVMDDLPVPPSVY